MDLIDTGAKDELIARIGQEIAASPKLDPGWKSLSIVFTFDDGLPSNFGYAYVGDGAADWKAFSSTSDALEEDVVRLRDVMKAETKAAWHQALFQLMREEREMKFEFAYDGETRWKVTPGNVEQTVTALRPRP